MNRGSVLAAVALLCAILHNQMLFEYTMYAGDGYVSKCGTEQPIERGSAQTGVFGQCVFQAIYSRRYNRFLKSNYVDTRCYVRENYGEMSRKGTGTSIRM
jgi:hypothetical protein